MRIEGKTLVRKLGQKIKSEDKKEVKLEGAPDPLEGNYEHQQPSADNKDKSSLFIKEEDQPVKNMAPAEAFSEEKTIVTEKIVVKEESIQAQ